MTSNWLWISFKVFNGFLCWSTLSWNFKNVFFGQSFYFFINLINDVAFPYHEYCICAIFAAPCIDKINEPFSYNRFSFSCEILLLFLYLRPLVHNFLNLLFPTIGKFPVAICRWWTRACTITWQNDIALKKGFNI